MDPQLWLEQQERRSAELLERAERAKATLAETRVTATSRDQCATVTTGAGGVLLDVRLSPRASTMPLEQVSARIMEAYGQATAQAAAQTIAVMAELAGPDSDMTSFIATMMPKRADPEQDGPRW